MLDSEFVIIRQELLRLISESREVAETMPTFGKNHWQSKESLISALDSCLFTIKYASPFHDSLPERAANCLKRAGLMSVDDVCSRTSEQLLEITNLGETSLRQIKFALHRMGRKLGDNVEVSSGL